MAFPLSCRYFAAYLAEFLHIEQCALALDGLSHGLSYDEQAKIAGSTGSHVISFFLHLRRALMFRATTPSFVTRSSLCKINLLQSRHKAARGWRESPHLVYVGGIL